MHRPGIRAVIVATLAMTSGSVEAAMTTEQRLRALETLVRQQQQEIEQLRGELRQQKAAGAAVSSEAPGAAAPAKPDTKAAVASVPKWVDKFTPFGDIRVRQEGFYNQPKPEEGGERVVARNRTRYRWRVGLKYAYSEELGATVRLASGNPDDPISTNESFDGSFSRKNANLDWAYLTVAPGKSFGIRPGLLTVNAGKFPNPMFRVGELVFDDDLSPEGFNETVQLLDQPMGPLDQVKVHAQQWTFEEVSDAEDGWMFGGQVNPIGHVGNVQIEGGIAQYWWLNPDLIARTANSNSSIRDSIEQHRLVRSVDDDGNTTIEGFESAFNQTNVSLAAQVPITENVPFRVYGDYVHNWDAPASEANGMMVGFRVGQTKEQGDLAGSLLYEYLEREAVIGAFSWSDIGNGGTNVQGPVVALEYQLLKPLTLTARSYFTRFIDPPPDVDNRMQVRLQLDALLKF
jgi:hypothetical protein